jgi:hypothetical protein
MPTGHKGMSVGSTTTKGMTPICETAPDLWFDTDPTAAVDACCKCHLMTPCLNIALRAEGTVGAQYRFGIWGGLTPEQRETLALADRRNRRDVGAA